MRRNWNGVVLTMAVAGTLVACAQVERGSSELKDFYKPVQARQCEASGASSEKLQLELAALANAQVRVASASCGHDGRMYPAVCGAPTGDVWLIRIDAADAADARAVGFEPVPSDASMQASKCR